MPKKVKQGTVVSDKMEKAIVVQVAEKKAHKKYKKTMTFTKNFKVRDMENQCHVGDVVTIVESKPLSGSIRWTLDKVVSVAQ
ncbi:MAG: 30S ribosomal protein S17 [Candidatus Gastranaerophilales bacterium]|jgi:small subunit ribosomal protein S17|nr:30S ribosomal protein S17 [Cyanobacteria bacterium SIG27]MBQ4646672.1 30S ribosomal protein S17 [Candidatus Gastranaerophilales bacterium]MBR5304847.1 30S ribosomal protein S17 [Candidatus Gastranaerophilales bacterium]